MNFCSHAFLSDALFSFKWNISYDFQVNLYLPLWSRAALSRWNSCSHLETDTQSLDPLSVSPCSPNISCGFKVHSVCGDKGLTIKSEKYRLQSVVFAPTKSQSQAWIWCIYFLLQSKRWDHHNRLRSRDDPTCYLSVLYCESELYGESMFWP